MTLDWKICKDLMHRHYGELVIHQPKQFIDEGEMNYASDAEDNSRTVEWVCVERVGR
jgi:hypothetical protein